MTEHYRFSLSRTVDPREGDRLAWCLLNPSTADDTIDDPTMRRVVRFTRDHGFADLTVVNLFAARATQPIELVDMAEHGVDPRGRLTEADYAINNAVEGSDAVVFAWGASCPKWVAHLAAERIDYIREVCRTFDRVPLCLGTTKAGHPRHPLYVAADTRLRPFRVAVAA